MSRFAIHIHLFLTSKDSELVAYNNLRRIKKSGFTVIVTSPKPLPEDFYSLIDYFYFDRENQLFERNYEDIKPIIHWFSSSFCTMNFAIQKVQPHGLAVLRSMIKGCQVAKIAGFDYIIRFEYDDLFGKQSIKKLKERVNWVIDSELDFCLYKNDYGTPPERSDVSVHLMFYRCDAFLSLFETIRNEEDYNAALESFGLTRKAILIEEFIWNALNKSSCKIHYEAGNNQAAEFSDTHFNFKQIDLSTKNGLLCDVMLIKDANGYRSNSIALCVSNLSSEDDTDVYFDLYDANDKLHNTIKVCITYLGEINYSIIDSCDNVSIVKIRHNEEGYYKTISVYKQEGVVRIKDPLIVGYETHSEIVLK